MTSQLNVDTIVDKAGSSGPSLPNTTARTYTIHMRCEASGTNYDFIQSNGDNAAYGFSCPFLFTIKEIAG